MNDGSWIKVGEDHYVNMAAVALIEESTDATTLTFGRPGAEPVKVTDGQGRRLIHAFVDQNAGKPATAAAGAPRY